MYDFRTLSPLDFEELVRDLLQGEFGIVFESFGPGRDLGIDFRFAANEGKAVVQAKHYVDTGPNGLISAARKENSKVAKLKPKRYLFATSVALSPVLKEKLKKAMPAAPMEDKDIFGQSDLNNLLGRHPDVEKRHFKLWLASTAVLERILHSGVYNRTESEMNMVRDIVPKFVHNDAVPRAEEILNKRNVLIIAGEPGVGKSTLARMLMWLHAQQGWQITVIDDIRDAIKVRSDGQKQLIFFDDFLGQIKLSVDFIRTTDQQLPPALQRVIAVKDFRFILTTRDYILRQAQWHSDRLSSSVIDASELVLSVGHYTRASKAQILFNHIYFSNLTAQDRDSLLSNDFFLTMIDHRNFNPRLIELLTSADYVVKSGVGIRDAIQLVLDNPKELWKRPYQSHISDEGRALMHAVFFNYELIELAALERSFKRMVKVMGLSFPRAEMPMRFRAAVKELEGSVIAIADRAVRFSNPGVRDFLQSVLVRERFVELVAEVATEFGELNQAWTAYWGQTPEPSPSDSVVGSWLGAGRRLFESKTGTALDRLKLIVDMYDRLTSAELESLVEGAAIELAEFGLKESEMREGIYLLEVLEMSLLPLPIQINSKRRLCTEICEAFVEYCTGLSSDEFESVADGLAKFCVDKEATSASLKKAFEVYIDNIRNDLSEMHSESDLDSYERDFRKMMKRHGVESSQFDYRVNARREDLANEEQPTRQTHYTANRTTVTQASDDELRSMFNSLRTD